MTSWQNIRHEILQGLKAWNKIAVTLGTLRCQRVKGVKTKNDPKTLQQVQRNWLLKRPMNLGSDIWPTSHTNHIWVYLSVYFRLINHSSNSGPCWNNVSWRGTILTFKTSDSLEKCKSAVLLGREPAHMLVPPLHQVMTCGPAWASQGDAAGEGISSPSAACHRPVLGVAQPPGGTVQSSERRHCAGEGEARGGDHLPWYSSTRHPSGAPSNKEHCNYE